MIIRRYAMPPPHGHSSAAQPRLARSAWQPATDVYEMSSGIMVKVELAGVPEDKIDIVLDQNRLIISGERPDDCAASGEQVYHHASISYGEFRVEIRLPGPVDSDKVEASYNLGFLYVSLPKAAPHRLQVNVRQSEPQQGGNQ